MVIGVLLIPLGRLTRASRVRLFLDALLALVALTTFSWYFLIGPTTVNSTSTVVEKIVSAAYPGGDLMMMLCVSLLLTRPLTPKVRRAGLLLSLGMLIVVMTDSVYDYQNLHNSYITGTILDLGWSLGYMVIALAFIPLYLALASDRASLIEEEVTERPRVGATLLLYALVPAVGLLWLIVHNQRGSAALTNGVTIGTIVLITVIIVRQIVALSEIQLLYAQLHTANRKLADTNDELYGANQQLESLATTDPLTGLPNHAAMATAMDRELGRAHRFERPCSLIFIDIDHFKSINDGYGHQTGDGVLREIDADYASSIAGHGYDRTMGRRRICRSSPGMHG